MKRKKFWIIFSIIFAVVFVFVMVFAFGFRLKTVEAEYWQTLGENTKISGILDKVKTDGEFDYGKNLLTLDLSESIAKIEKANPYVKVYSAKKHFPNIVRIHIVERTPEYRVRCEEDENTWLILDYEFKILDSVSADDLAESEFYSTTIEVAAEFFTIPSSYEIGDFVTFDNEYGEYLTAISDGIYGKTTDSASASSVTISEEDGITVFTIYMRNDTQADGRGCAIKVYGTESLKELVYAGVTAFETEVGTNSDINLPSTIIIAEIVNGKIEARRTN